MNRLESGISSIDYLLDSKRRKHIAGGILLSMSLLFAGLAITVISLKTEESKHESYIE